MKYKPMGMIAVLSFALVLSQIGCGTQAQTSTTGNNGGSGAATSTSSTSDTSGTTGTSGSNSTTTAPATDQAQTPSSPNSSSTTSGSGSSASTSTGTTGSSSSGSSSSSQSSGQPNATSQTTLPKDWEMVSKMYPVEGTIVSLDQSSDTLHSIKIKVSKNIKGASTSMDSPNEPFALGSTAEIQFDEALADQGTLNLKVGDVVVINTGQYSFLPKTNAIVWASKFQWVSVQKDGKFYNNKGNVVSVE